MAAFVNGMTNRPHCGFCNRSAPLVINVPLYLRALPPQKWILWTLPCGQRPER